MPYLRIFFLPTYFALNNKRILCIILHALRDREFLLERKFYFELKEYEGSGAPPGAYVGSAKILDNKFPVLKLEDMIDMEFVKFVFKFSNYMFPRYFNNYLRSLETIYNDKTCQNAKKDFFHRYARTKWGKNMIQHRSLNLWK